MIEIIIIGLILFLLQWFAHHPPLLIIHVKFVGIHNFDRQDTLESLLVALSSSSFLLSKQVLTQL